MVIVPATLHPAPLAEQQAKAKILLSRIRLFASRHFTFTEINVIAAASFINSTTCIHIPGPAIIAPQRLAGSTKRQILLCIQISKGDPPTTTTTTTIPG